jgi:hypothetical protein
MGSAALVAAQVCKYESALSFIAASNGLPFLNIWHRPAAFR